ncbi:hypothetical protein L6452_23283 [Arctium lappa]|uniref:Uncharacterized protein n=1 Tax=Arctium lappa TaxID=4217 RepID=A0ACB9B2P0_ARCLA|nr:hypothetical protein L6452_23283 [Arctium lappa]
MVSGSLGTSSMTIDAASGETVVPNRSGTLLIWSDGPAWLVHRVTWLTNGLNGLVRWLVGALRTSRIAIDAASYMSLLLPW